MWLIRKLTVPLLGLFLIVRAAFAVEFPQPQGHVNDFAEVLSVDFVQELEADLRDFEQETTVEAAVVTIKSLEDGSIEETAVRLFEQWEIGKEGKDNGLLLLIAMDDRKMRIEVGYGLEPIITDGRAGQIIREQMQPAFRQEDYDGGVRAAVEKIKGYIVSGEPPAEKEIASSVGRSNLFLFMMGAIILAYLASFWGRSKRIWPGGVVGAILGFLIASLVGGLLLGFWGLFLDWLLSRNYKQLKRRKRPTSFFRSWGGFSSGGGRSSGGSFGGFGGGSSGGGGASGGW